MGSYSRAQCEQRVADSLRQAKPIVSAERILELIEPYSQYYFSNEIESGLAEYASSLAATAW